MSPERSIGYVLVVDDDRELAKLVSNCFRETGFLVYTAFTPEDALRIVAQRKSKNHQLHTLITDLNIKPSRINGFELMDRVLVECPSATTALMTASDETVLDGYKAQLDAFKLKNGTVFHKPFPDIQILYDFAEKLMPAA